MKKEHINQVKELLKDYGTDRKRVEAKRNAIKNIDDQLDTLKGGWTNSEPTQGGGSSQEDKIIKLLDKKKRLEEEIQEIQFSYSELKYALRQLDSRSKAIIYNCWVYRDSSIREQAKRLYMTKSAVWYNSELAMKKIYGLMKEQGYSFN